MLEKIKTGFLLIFAFVVTGALSFPEFVKSYLPQEQIAQAETQETKSEDEQREVEIYDEPSVPTPSEAKERWMSIASTCVPSVLAEAIGAQESDGWRADATRFEDTWFNGHCAKIKSLEKRRICATSIGIGQMGYGLWGKECGWSSFVDGFNVEKNARCFCHVMATNKKNKLESAADIKNWIALYNGSGARARQYAEKIFNAVSAKIIHQELIDFKG
jgi:hypothetical protein